MHSVYVLYVHRYTVYNTLCITRFTVATSCFIVLTFVSSRCPRNVQTRGGRCDARPELAWGPPGPAPRRAPARGSESHPGFLGAGLVLGPTRRSGPLAPVPAHLRRLNPMPPSQGLSTPCLYVSCPAAVGRPVLQPWRRRLARCPPGQPQAGCPPLRPLIAPLRSAFTQGLERWVLGRSAEETRRLQSPVAASAPRGVKQTSGRIPTLRVGSCLAPGSRGVRSLYGQGPPPGSLTGRDRLAGEAGRSSSDPRAENLRFLQSEVQGATHGRKPLSAAVTAKPPPTSSSGGLRSGLPSTWSELRQGGVRDGGLGLSHRPGGAGGSGHRAHGAALLQHTKARPPAAPLARRQATVWSFCPRERLPEKAVKTQLPPGLGRPPWPRACCRVPR